MPLSSLVFSLDTTALSQKGLKPKQLHIYKNENYFVVKEVNVTPKNGIWMMEMKQNPFLANFWITPNKDVETNSIDYKMDTFKTNRKAMNYIHLIHAIEGKSVSLYYRMVNNNTNIQNILGENT